MSDKCRGCGAAIWKLVNKRDPMRGSHVVHNEANCLASRLDSAALEFEKLVSLGLPYWTQEHIDRMRAALKGPAMRRHRG